MKIIKPGKIKPDRRVTCAHCECEFEYEHSDTYYYLGTWSEYRFVRCPECGYQIVVDNYCPTKGGLQEPNIKLMKENENGTI